MTERASRPHNRGVSRRLEVPFTSWWRIARRVWLEAGRKHLPLFAAGVAFYFLLAVFPALIALVNLYGLIADPEQLYRQVQNLAAVVPPGAVDLLDARVRDIVAGDSKTGLGLGFVVSLLGVLWSASAGTLGLIRAINAAYGHPENRSFVRVRGLALGFTLGAIFLVLFGVGLVGVAPQVLGHVGLGDQVQALIGALRWPVLTLAMLSGLALVYRYAPARPPAGWRWVSPGSAVATALWLGGSGLFSWYLASFGRFNEIYGSLGAVIALLIWFFLTAFAVLAGAEINAQIERRVS